MKEIFIGDSEKIIKGIHTRANTIETHCGWEKLTTFSINPAKYNSVQKGTFWNSVKRLWRILFVYSATQEGLKRDSRVFSFILCLTSELPFCYSSPGDSPCFDRWRTTITYVTVFPGNGDSMLYRGGRETRPNEIGITCPKGKRNITINSQLRWSQIRRDFRTAP